MASYVYVLTRPAAASADEFRDRLVGDVAPRIVDVLPGVNWLSVTARDESLGSPIYPEASVEHDGRVQPVDAVLELSCAPSYPLLEPLHELLDGCAATVQGWRTRQLAAHGDASPIELGARAPWVRNCVFVQRADGMSSDDFVEQWGVRHARNHAEETRAPWDPDAALLLYEEHLLVEATTPMAWLVHGYEPVVRDDAGWQRMTASIAARTPATRPQLWPAGVYGSKQPARAMAGRDYFLVANADRSRAHRRRH